MKKISFLIILLIITSCIRKTQNSGYSFEEINMEDVKVGVTTKVTIMKELGSPSLKTNANKKSEEVWIYYADTKHGYLFFRPKVKNRKVLAITFDKNNVVASKEQCGIGAEGDKSKEIKTSQRRKKRTTIYL